MKKNWIKIELRQICNVISGKDKKSVVNNNGNYPIYGSGGQFGYANDYLCEPGTTIIGRKGTINNPIFVNEKFWNVDTAFGLSPNQIVLPKFLYFFCVRYNFNKLDKSTTIPSLAKRDVQKITFPLPPLPEQRAIVAKIEQLFSELDNGIKNLKKVQKQIQSYRQAVLKQAFAGELTEDWRAEQDSLPDPDEMLKEIKSEKKRRYQKKLDQWKENVKKWRSAKGLLPDNFPQIKKSKYYLYIIKDDKGNTYSGVVNNLQDRWETLRQNEDTGNLQLYYYEENKRKGDAQKRLKYIQSKAGQKWLEKIAAEKEDILQKFSRKPRKPRKPKEVEPITEKELEELSDLPNSWTWAKLANITFINPPKPKFSKNEKVSFLPMKSVKEESGAYDLTEKISFEDGKSRYTSFKEGDVIFAKITPCMENGKIAYLDRLISKYGFGSTEFHVIRSTESISGKFLFYYLVQEKVRNDAQHNMTGTAGQLRVPTSYISNLPFPVLDYTEQSQIVNKIDERFSICDKLEAEIEKSLEKAEKLRQSILKKAFEGRLLNEKELEQTRQAPDWEPAEQLWEKINK